MARVCHSLGACHRHTASSLAAVIGLSHNDVTALRSLRCVHCVGWKPSLSRACVPIKHGRVSSDDFGSNSSLVELVLYSIP